MARKCHVTGILWQTKHALPHDVAQWDYHHIMTDQMSGSSAVGRCVSCDGLNSYQNCECEHCGARLPWADALDAVAREAEARGRTAGETRFRSLLDSNVVPLSFWHADGRILEANDAYLKLTGTTRQQLDAGHVRWKNLSSPEQLELDHQAVAQWNEGRDSVWFEKEYVLSDGRHVPVLVGGALLGNRSDYGIGIALDITQLKAVETALRASEEQYRAVFDATRDGLIVCTLDGRVAELNRAMCQMHGFSREESIGAPVAKFIEPGYEHTFRDAVALISADPQSEYRQELRDRRADGTSFPIEVTATIFRFQGQPHILGVIRDISDRQAAEEALFRQFSITEAITQNVAEALFMMDASGCTTYLNPAAQSTFGWTLDEMRNRTLHDVLHYQHADGTPFPMSNCPLGGVLQEGQTVTDHEDVFWHRDGYPVAVSCSNAPIWRDGKLVGAVLAVHDITQRKKQDEQRLQVEQELQATEERLRLANEAADIGTWDLNTLTGELTWSERCREIFGVAPDEHLNLAKFFKLVHPLDLQRVDAAVRQTLSPQGDGHYDIEYRTVMPDGTARWIASRGRAVFEDDEQGMRRAVRFVGTAIDIDERRRSIDALRLLSAASATLTSSLDHRETLHRLVHLPVPDYADFCVVDLLADEGDEMTEVFVAHADPGKAELMRELRRLIGFETPPNVGESFLLHTGQAELCRQMSQEIFETHIINPRAREIARQLDVQSYMVLPLRARGRSLGVLTFCLSQPGLSYSVTDLRFAGDLAERVAYAVDNARLYHQARVARQSAENAQHEAEAARRRAETALNGAEAAQQIAEEANRAKDEFLATLSHELRTPLNAILGWASLLNAGHVDEPTVTRAGEVIERNVRAQAQLINDLFDVSRIITGKLSLDAKPLDLVPLVANSIESVEASTRAKNIKLQVFSPPEPVCVAGDTTRLQQVLWNLLSNAARFTPQGGRIEVRLQRIAGTAQIEVCDSGQGIDPEFLPYVFDRFRQADSSSTRRHGGLGLGLAIVRHLVEMHGGTVQAQSEGIGHGASFIVRLPLLSSQQIDDSEQSVPAQPLFSLSDMPEPSLADVPPELLSNLKVLIIDDEQDSRELARDVLELYGAQVQTLPSAQDAVTVLSSAPFDVLISDIAMPGENGYEMLQHVRAGAVNGAATIPAIALTALARPSDRHAALAAGFQEHLTKPVEPVTLAVTVASLTGRL